MEIGEGKEREKAGDRVRTILRNLGHQLEEEIAEKNIWQHATHQLQGVKALYNATDRRKLSEARVLNGAELIALRDRRLAKDKKAGQEKLKKVTRLKNKGKGKPASMKVVHHTISPIISRASQRY
jgi:hypothetical protein